MQLSSNIDALLFIFAQAFSARERKLNSSVVRHDDLGGSAHMTGFFRQLFKDLLDVSKKPTCIKKYTTLAAAQTTADIKDAIHVMNMMGATYNDFCYKIKGMDLAKVITAELEDAHAKRHPRVDSDKK